VIAARARQALWLGAFALAAPGIVRWAELLPRPPAGDFLAYYRAAERLALHDPTLYSAPPADAPDYLYPPLFAALLQPLTALAPAAAQDLWQIASIVCALAAVVLVGRSVPRALTRKEWALAFAALILFPPFFRTIRIGQVTALLLLLLAVSIHATAGGRDRLAGAAYASGAAIKLVPALYLITELARGRRHLFVAGVAGGFALALASLWLGGLTLHQSFAFELLPRLSANVLATPPNQSLASFFARLGADAHVVPTALGLAMLAATLWLSWRAAPGAYPLIMAMATVLTLILPARSWDLNYLALLAPLLLMLWSDQLSDAAVAAYGLITLEQYWPLLPDHWAFQSFALIGALALWGACAWSLARGRLTHA